MNAKVRELEVNTKQVDLKAAPEATTKFVGEDGIGRVLKTNQGANLIAAKVFVEGFD